MVIYVVFVSASSQVPSALVFAPSWVIHILFLLALVAFFKDVGLEQSDVVWTALGLTAFLHVCAFLIALALWPDEIRRMNLPVVANVRTLTYFLMPAATVMGVLFVTRLEKALSSVLLFAGAAFFIIYTGSRAATTGVIVGWLAAGAYCAWFRQKIQINRTLVLFAVLVFLVILAESLPPLPWGTIVDRWFEALSATGPEFSSGRNEVWPRAMKAISQNWVWGYGPALQNEIPHQTPWPDRSNVIYQPHNIGLQLLLHWGLLGTLILALTIFSFSANIFYALRNEPALAIPPFAILVAMLTQALVDGNLFYPFSVVVAIIAFAMLEAIGRQHGDRSVSRAEATPINA